jgi:hypothetical protein
LYVWAQRDAVQKPDSVARSLSAKPPFYSKPQALFLGIPAGVSTSKQLANRAEEGVFRKADVVHGTACSEVPRRRGKSKEQSSRRSKKIEDMNTDGQCKNIACDLL